MACGAGIVGENKNLTYVHFWSGVAPFQEGKETCGEIDDCALLLHPWYWWFQTVSFHGCCVTAGGVDNSLHCEAGFTWQLSFKRTVMRFNSPSFRENFSSDVASITNCTLLLHPWYWWFRALSFLGCCAAGGSVDNSLHCKVGFTWQFFKRRVACFNSRSFKGIFTSLWQWIQIYQLPRQLMISGAAVIWVLVILSHDGSYNGVSYESWRVIWDMMSDVCHGEVIWIIELPFRLSHASHVESY